MVSHEREPTESADSREVAGFEDDFEPPAWFRRRVGRNRAVDLALLGCALAGPVAGIMGAVLRGGRPPVFELLLSVIAGVALSLLFAGGLAMLASRSLPDRAAAWVHFTTGATVAVAVMAAVDFAGSTGSVPGLWFAMALLTTTVVITIVDRVRSARARRAA